MKKRIFLSICIVCAIVLVASLILILGVLQSSFSNQLLSEVKSETNFIAAGVEKSGIEYLNTLESVDKSRRITLISADGTVLYDNMANASEMENHSDREEFIQALEYGFGQSKRYSETLSEKTVYCAKRLSDGNVIRVASTQYSSFSVFILLAQPVAFIILIALILASVLASVVSNKITKPLNEIDFDAKEDKNTVYEEIAPLYSKIYSQKRTIERQLEAAKEKQKEFAMITDAMSEGLIITDLSTDILSYNSSAPKLLGYTGEDAVGKSVFTLNRTPEFTNAVTSSLSGNHTETSIEVNGKTLSVMANPAIKDGKTVGAAILILDITEKANRDTLRREFTANVSHELKTPLTSISGFAELIKDGMVKEEDVPDCAGRIYNEASRLITLINDIIEISALDEGAGNYKTETQSLKKIADEVVSSLLPIAEKRGIKMEVCADGDGIINGSREILYEMIYNLCDNAIKYNNENGSVTVCISENQNKVLLSVEDTGIGIPDADKDRVFERFYRVDKSHSREIGGTGLGLSIVKHGAIFHGAAISLDSTLGKGTKITLSFPKQK